MITINLNINSTKYFQFKNIELKTNINSTKYLQLKDV